MTPPDDKAIEAAIVARCEVGKSHQGFLYGAGHVIRDLRKPPDEQIVWKMTEVRGDELGLGLDYERCHAEMMRELERIAMRAAAAAYEAALWQPIESARVSSGPCEGDPVLTFDSGNIDVSRNYRGTWYGRHGELTPTKWRPLPAPPKLPPRPPLRSMTAQAGKMTRDERTYRCIRD